MTTAVKERAVKETPLLMRPELVRATLEDRKTMTRMIIKPQPLGEHDKCFGWFGDGLPPQAPCAAKGLYCESSRGLFLVAECPYKVGMRLWVRETWQTHCELDDIAPRDLPPDTRVQYPATYDGWVSKKRVPIHMPRWASRLTLEITGVRVERIQDITIDDIGAEGVQLPCTADGRLLCRVSGENLIYDYLPDGFFLDKTPLDKERIGMVVRANFASTWDTINGKGAWQRNDFCWVIEFRRIAPAVKESVTHGS